MTHQPSPDPDSSADAPFPPLDIAPPDDARTEPLDGVPVGEVPDETFDLTPEEAFDDALFDPESMADEEFDVVLEMGHVALTEGATGTAGEQNFARAVAGHAAARLRQDGRTVLVIECRTEPPQSKAYVSIHADGATAASAHGASVGFRTDKGQQIAHAWKAAYQRLGWPRGFRDDNYTKGLAEYYGTGDAAKKGTAFAFILEAGFLTNVEDRALLANQSGHERVAEAIRQAVTEAIGPGKDGFLMALTDEQQASLIEMTKATNNEVGRLAVAIRDETNGLGAQMAALRRDIDAIKAKLDAQ